MPIPTIVFLTAIPLEYDAVIAHLPEGKLETRAGGATYYVNEYVTPANRRWRVAVRKLSAMGNYEAAQESIDAISDYLPSYMFFVGVAGGIKDVQLGDVVASSMARGYESVKVEETVIKQRAHVEYPSRQLVELAFQVASQSQWRSKIKLPEGAPKALVCPIASGEKVITSPAFLQQLLHCCSDAVAVEMEAIGFLRTFRKRSHVQGIVIRGISDMVAGKNPEHDQKWQPIAARHAAGFAWAMVDELPIPTVIPHELPPLRIFAVPLSQRNEYFTGREAILQQLGELLVKQRVVAVHGLGGVGKTQTLVQYAHLHRADYAAIFWMLAASVNDFRSSFWTLAQVLNLPTESLKQEDIEKNVKFWLTTHSDWLLLLDNADELALVKTFVAEIKAHGQVLISTRAVATRPVAVPVEVAKMTEEEGAQFLFKRIWGVEQELTTRPDYATACQLVTLLDGLPLALEQAAAYIDENQSSFAEYLQDYQRYAKQLLARRGELFDEKDHPLPVAATWQASLEKIGQRNPQTLELLNACAFLPAVGIPEEILETLFEVDSFQLRELIQPALAYSMLKRDAATKHLFIHRLVQTVLKFELASDTQRQWAERIIATVIELFPNPDDIQQWATCDRLLLSALTGAELIETYSIETEVAVRLLNQTAYYLQHRKGEYDQALPLFERALAIHEQVLGPVHPSYATILNNLAELYWAKSEYGQALPLFEQVLAITEQALGSAHPNYAISLNNLAELYRSKGEYDQALLLSKKALAIREQVLEPAHPDYATSLNTLAELYRSKGEYDQALPLFEKALAIREQVLGPAHPDYAISLNNLASLYHAKGEYDQALPLFERALAILKKVLGENHPNTKIVEGNYQKCLSESELAEF
jgi:tetratricopeptide (TPR) repeat protein/nucleoside phosphorylase